MILLIGQRVRLGCYTPGETVFIVCGNSYQLKFEGKAVMLLVSTHHVELGT